MTQTTEAVTAGAASAITTAITTNLELGQVLFVGLLGALAYFLKSCDIKYLRGNKLAALKTVPIRLLTPMTITAIVYYVGTDAFNTNVRNIGNPVWLFAGLLAALNYEVALIGIGDLLKIAISRVKGKAK